MSTRAPSIQSLRMCEALLSATGWRRRRTFSAASVITAQRDGPQLHVPRLVWVWIGGSFAEYYVAPARILFKLPDGVSFEEGALFEPAGVAMHAVEQAHIVPGDTVVVFGVGPIGLVAIQMLNVCGASHVVAVDIDDYRLGLAENYGAIPLNPTKLDVAAEVKKLTSRRHGADVVVEMTGSPRVYPSMFELLRKEGRIVIVGHAGEVPINVTEGITLKGASIKGSYGRGVWELGPT